MTPGSARCMVSAIVRRSAVFSFSNKSAATRIAGRKSQWVLQLYSRFDLSGSSVSCEDLLYRHAEVYFQPFLARDFKLAGIESELVQHGGMNVCDVMTILYGMESQFVSGSVSNAALDPTASHPGRKAERMVVATAVFSFDPRRAAEFSRPDHDRFVQQTSLFQILHQPGDRFVDFCAKLGVILAKFGVRVPAVLSAAVEDLNKADTALYQSARREALLAKFVGFLLVETIEFLCLWSFVRELEEFRNCRLHPKRQLIRLNAGPHGGIIWILDTCQLIEALQELKFADLFFLINVGSGLGKGQRVLRIDLQLHSAVLRTEIVAAHRGLSSAAGARHLTQHDELRQVLIQGS